MSDVIDRLTQIGKIEDPVERANALLVYCDELLDGPWSDMTTHGRSAAEADHDLPQLSA